MKAYVIRDEVRKQKGKPEYTRYEYSYERDEQARKRMERYKREGYKVSQQQNWWTTIEIILK